MRSVADQARPSWAEVTLTNWMTAPYNRLAFQHVGELIPSAAVAAGATPWRWPEPSAVSLGPDPELADLLDATDTDAFLVLRSGMVEHEEYRRGMNPDSRHLCMSVSKSVAGTLAGVLVAGGDLDPAAQVTDLVPEFASTGMAGATVRHLLDMRTGTQEQITTLAEQRAYYATAQWAPAAEAPVRDPDTRSHFWRFQRDRAHGGDFGYRSTLTCVLALLMERATGRSYPDLLSERLWQPMGAERDAEVTVDAAGNALADIGLSCTARDLARFGEMLRRGGRGGGERCVVPPAWIADILSPDHDQQEAFREQGTTYLPHPDAYYRDQWWVASPRTADRGGAWFALGIHGQLLYIDEDAELVVVKFSSWPEPWVPESASATYRLCARLAGSNFAG